MIGALVIAAWALGPSRTSGAVIDLSMAEVVATTVSEYLAAASVDQPAASARVRRAVHRTSDDRWCAVELRGEQCEPEQADVIAALITTNRADDAAYKLRNAGVEAAVVRRADELITDPHLTARGFFPEIDHPDPDLSPRDWSGCPGGSTTPDRYDWHRHPRWEVSTPTNRGPHMPTPPTDRRATVWSSTFIPTTSPITGSAGYSVAWVDTDTERLQVLVDGARPAPGTPGG